MFEWNRYNFMYNNGYLNNSLYQLPLTTSFTVLTIGPKKSAP